MKTLMPHIVPGKFRALPTACCLLATALLLAPALHAATYDWNTTNGTWDTTTANWAGPTTWVNGNDAVFNNTATPSTVTLDGTISATSVQFGSTSTNNATYTLTGGALNVSGALSVIGNNSNSWGNYPASFPTVTINSDVNVTGNTTISRAILNITGGNYTTDRIVNTVNAGSDGFSYGVLTISGGTVTATNGISSPGAYTIQNFNGGTLYTSSIAGSYTEHWTTTVFRMTFNGTVVKATSDTSSFVTSSGTQTAFISNGGAIFDSNDHNIGIGLALVNTTGQNGTLTKQGNGTLTLSGNNTYTGTTTVSAGTLLINGSTSTSSAVTVASGATLGGNGTVGGFTTVNGNLNPGNSPGVLTFSSGLTLNGTATMEINSDGTPGTDYDQVVVSSGTTTFGGALVFTFGPSALLDNDSIALFNFAGTSQGNFSSVTSTGFYSGTWSVGVTNDTWTFNTGSQLLTFSEVTGNLNVVPEPSTWALLAFSLTTVMVFRRRRRE